MKLLSYGSEGVKLSKVRAVSSYVLKTRLVAFAQQNNPVVCLVIQHVTLLLLVHAHNFPANDLYSS